MISKFLKMAPVLLIVGLFFGCGDDDTPAEAMSVKFNATIEGENLRSDDVVASLSSEGKVLTIVGTDDTGGQTITIRVGSDTEAAPLVMEQSYDVTDESLPVFIRYTTGGQTFQTSVDTSGMININSFDPINDIFVFGAFRGELVNNSNPSEGITISNGAFNGVELITQ